MTAPAADTTEPTPVEDVAPNPPAETPVAVPEPVTDPEPANEANPMIAEVEAEEVFGTEPENVPPGSIQMFLRRAAKPGDPASNPKVAILWSAPTALWPMSAYRWLDRGIYYRWADIVLIPESVALFNTFDPTYAECKAMVDEWTEAAAIAVGKLQASANSFGSTRRQ